MKIHELGYISGLIAGGVAYITINLEPWPWPWLLVAISLSILSLWLCIKADVKEWILRMKDE